MRYQADGFQGFPVHENPHPLEDWLPGVQEGVSEGVGYQAERDRLSRLDGWLAVLGERSVRLIGRPSEAAADAVAEATLEVRRLLEELER